VNRSKRLVYDPPKGGFCCLLFYPILPDFSDLPLCPTLLNFNSSEQNIVNGLSRKAGIMQSRREFSDVLSGYAV
jgi:hypothetical protein